LFHTVYDSYEEGPNGRDYIGKHSTDNPYDSYKGSFKDESFNPDNKIVFAYAKTKEGAVWLEIMFQKVFGVVEDPQFANKSYQTSVKFSFSAPGERNPNFGNRWKWTPEQKKNLPNRSGKNNPRFGKKEENHPHFGKTTYHNPKTGEEKLFSSPPEGDWKLGRSPQLAEKCRKSGGNRKNQTQTAKTKERIGEAMCGRKWWVNAKNETQFLTECPGPGWQSGRKWLGG